MSEDDNNGGQSAEYRLSWELYEHCCQSDSFSEDGLREIIERHRLPPSHPLSDYDFFLEACGNEKVTEGIIQYFLEYFPDAASALNGDEWSSLNYAFFFNKNMTLNIAQRLIEAAPDLLSREEHDGDMPIHFLCGQANCINETAAVEILTFLLKKCPEAARHGEEKGRLPLFFAVQKKSPEFCRLLIEGYPGSERMADSMGIMPLHLACAHNAIATVEYLYKLYPDAINHATTDGYYPIHCAIESITERDDPERVIEVVKFLLDCNPYVKLQKCAMRSSLRIACDREYNDSNIEAGIQVIKIIYDAQPDAIKNETDIFYTDFFHQQVQSIMISELFYARQAQHHRTMTTPDDNGQLLLHRALANNGALGSIKLLVRGNPSAIRNFDNSGMIPLHVACQHHDSASVVKYLLDLNLRTLRAVDYDNNTALHLACRGAKYDNIALLLESNAVPVSKRNAHKKLPIDLLWESDAVRDRDSIEYTGSVFQLLRADPEMMINRNVNMKQQSKAVECSSQNGKKRKYSNA